MQKNSLANILCEKTIERTVSQRLRVAFNDNIQKIITKKQNIQQMFEPTAKNHMIKITQLHSLSNSQPRSCITTSASPCKQYQLKKMSELKQKSALQSFKFVQIQLKRKESPKRRDRRQTQLPELKTEEATKIFIASKWNLKSQIANMDFLTNQISGIHSVVVVRPHQAQNNSPADRAVLGTPKEIISSRELRRGGTKPKTRLVKLIDEIQEDRCKQEISTRELSNFPQKSPFSPVKRYDRHIIQQKKYQENIEKEKKQMLQTRKQLNKNYAKPFNPPQNISAFAYIVYQADLKKTKLRKFSAHQRGQEEINQIRKMFVHSHKVVVSLNSRTTVQIASLTKIMTCLVALEIAARFNLCLDEETVKVGIFEQNIGGTTAGIKKGQIYTTRQLLYGLMLPSGNDASVAVAVWGGRALIQREQLKRQQNSTQTDSTRGENKPLAKKKAAYDRFIAQMNLKAAELNMQKTKYCNSHGLSNSQSRSCCFDLAILCQYAMRSKTFREVVSCKVYQSQIKMDGKQTSLFKPLSKDCPLRQSKRSLKNNISINCLNSDEARLELQQMKNMDQLIQQDFYDQEQMVSQQREQKITKPIRWENTHQLLQQKSELYVGIKTGITCTAGPCLASCIELKGRRWIIIVLDCKTMKMRIKDTQNLRRWTFAKQAIKFSQKSGNQALEDQLVS